MNILEKLTEELDNVEYINLDEALSQMNVNWDFDDVEIISASNNDKPHGDYGDNNGGSDDQGDKSDNNNNNNNDPNDKGKWKSGSGKKVEEDLPEPLDDHDIMQRKSDGTNLNDAFNEIYEKLARRTGKKNPDNWKGAAGNMFRDDVKNVVRRKLPMDKIKRQLRMFKEEISKTQVDDDTYQLSILSGTSRGGEADTHRPVEIDDDGRNKQSAILFFCVDTSGSMGDEEFELVYGWLKEIAEYFKGDSGGIPGRVFVLEYDSRVYTPIKEWRNDKKIFSFRGGGGNNVNKVYQFLNQHFVESKRKGNKVINTFVFDESKPGLFDNTDKKVKYKIKHQIDVTYASQTDRQVQLKKLHDKKFKYGDILRESYDFANVPFLLFFTDGYDEVPTDFGPLYKHNLGNILYIVTSKMYLGNVRPRNFIYCDMHVESFADSFDTNGNIIENGQGNRWG